MFSLHSNPDQIDSCLEQKQCLGDSVMRFFCFRFFHESSSKPLKITVGSFQDIRKSRCTRYMNDTGGNLPPVSATPVANLPPVSVTPAVTLATGTAGVVDTGGQFCHRYQQQQRRLEWCTLSCQYLPELKKNLKRGPNEILRCLVETDS